MTVVADIIDEAFRESGLITELEHPTPTQSERALSRLQSIVMAAYGYEVGEPLVDWLIGDYETRYIANEWQYPIANSRLLLRMTDERTIYFPLQPMNGARMKVIDVLGNLATFPVTLDGQGRLIEGASQLVLNQNSINRTWIYDAEVANWVRVEGIDIDTQMPFPVEFDDYFITTLAMALSPRYSNDVSPMTVARMQDYLGKIRSRYRQTQFTPSELGLLRLTNDRRYWLGYSFGPWEFNRGYPLW